MAQQQPTQAPPEFVGDFGFSQALTGALRARDYAGALGLLAARPDIAQTPAGVRLRAELLVRLGRTTEAILLLEGHLARTPSDALARFQVGEIHFAAGRDRSASLAYRLALAGQLDEVRQSVVRIRLDLISNRRRTTISTSASLAPDSNLNNATSASTVDIYGLPFELSDDARRRAGVSATASFSGQRRFVISNSLSLTAGASAAIVDSRGEAFDVLQSGVEAGIELRSASDAQAALYLTYRDIDFAHEDFERWHGVRLDTQAFSNPQTRWDLSVHADEVDNQSNASQSGSAAGGSAARTRFLGPSALWRLSAAVEVRDAAGAEGDFLETHLTAGRLFPLPFLTLAYAQTFAQIRQFEEASSIFGVTRHDQEIGVSLRISKRDWAFRDVFPYVQASLTRAHSNVAIGRYSRERIEFGVTRDF